MESVGHRRRRRSNANASSSTSSPSPFPSVLRIFYPSDYFEGNEETTEEEEEKEVYGWIFPSGGGHFDTDKDVEDDTSEEEKEEEREVWNCVVSEIGPEKIVFDASSSSSSCCFSRAVLRVVNDENNGKSNSNSKIAVVEAKRIGKIVFDKACGKNRGDVDAAYFVTFRSKSPSIGMPFAVSVVDSKRRKREFDDILFVSVAREAIDDAMTSGNIKSNPIENNIRNSRRRCRSQQRAEDERIGIDAIVKVLSLSSFASYERQREQQRARRIKEASNSNFNFFTTISSAILLPMQKMLDEYDIVPYFYGSGKGNSGWKDGQLKLKPISGVSTSLRLLATRVAILLRRRERRDTLLFKALTAFASDVLLARLCFARIASHVQKLSSGFINGDYLIRNANWLAKGNPLGIKLHLPLSRTLSGVAILLAEGYASILGVRLHSIIRIIGERMWFLGLTTQLACLSDCMFLFTSHAAALHVYSSLLVTAQVAFGKFCYEAGFGRPLLRREEEKHLITQTKRQSTESLVFGVLFVPPIFLFFPTTFAYFASYLLLHAAALLVRATVVFLLSSLESAKNYYVLRVVGEEEDEEEGGGGGGGGVLILSALKSKEEEEEEEEEEERREQQQQIKVVQLARKKRRGLTTTTKIFAHKYGKHAAQFWGFSFMGSCANALRSFGRLPVGALKPFFEVF
jgi:hypothetical protein